MIAIAGHTDRTTDEVVADIDRDTHTLRSLVDELKILAAKEKALAAAEIKEKHTRAN